MLDEVVEQNYRRLLGYAARKGTYQDAGDLVHEAYLSARAGDQAVAPERLLRRGIWAAAKRGRHYRWAHPVFENTEQAVRASDPITRAEWEEMVTERKSGLMATRSNDSVSWSRVSEETWDRWFKERALLLGSQKDISAWYRRTFPNISKEAASRALARKRREMESVVPCRS